MIRPDQIPGIIDFWQTPRYSRLSVWVLLPAVQFALVWVVLPWLKAKTGLP